jgi:ferritin
MINEKVQKAFNQQIGAELGSAYIYVSMAAYFDSVHLRGMAKWMQVQAGEEVEHAMKFYKFIYERGGRVTLGPVDAPQSDWASPLAAFEDAYKHERKISGMINDLVDLAQKESDKAAENFLAWFIEEQVEEEAHAREICNQLKMIGESKNGLFMLNVHLGKRGEK